MDPILLRKRSIGRGLLAVLFLVAGGWGGGWRLGHHGSDASTVQAHAGWAFVEGGSAHGGHRGGGSDLRHQRGRALDPRPGSSQPHREDMAGRCLHCLLNYGRHCLHRTVHESCKCELSPSSFLLHFYFLSTSSLPNTAFSSLIEPTLDDCLGIVKST